MKIRKNLTKILCLGIFVFTMAFTPNDVNASSNYAVGTLFKLKGVQGAAVYQIGSDGQKYVFPDQNTFKTWHDDFSEVLEVALSILDEYNDGGTVTFQPGVKLLTHPNTARVYAVGEGGELTHIPNEATAIKFYGNGWATILLDIDPGLFAISYKTNNKKLSDDDLPEGTLVEEEDSGDYFLIEDGQKRRVSLGSFRLHGLHRKHIIKLKKLHDIYDEGDDIDDDEDDVANFDPGAGKHKVILCHKPTTANRTIRVSNSALRAHLAHGDVEGRCDDDEDDDDGDDGDDDDDTVTLPDITIDDIVVDPASPIANATTTITVYIKNSGELTVTSTDGILNVLASFEDFTNTASSTIPVVSEAEPLEPEESVTIVWTGYFTSNGTKTLTVTADESNELEEADETNNTYTEDISVVDEAVILPDITIDDIVVDPASPIANATTTATTITVYIKNSGEITLTDTTGILNGLASFEDFTNTASSTVPIVSVAEPFEPDEILAIIWTGYFTSVGEKTLTMTVDESNELEETDETNNTYTEDVTVVDETI